MRVDPVETDGVLFLAQEPPMSSTTADRDPVIHLAIELSCSTWLVAARLPGDEKPRLHRITGGDTAALLALISSLRARVAARLGAPKASSAALRQDGTASGCTGC
jgi:hypothetical protein